MTRYTQVVHKNIRLFWKPFVRCYKESSHEESKISAFLNLYPVFFVFFLLQFSFTGTGDSQNNRGGEGRGGDQFLFHSTTSINRTACIYQTATRWDLPPFRITIWLTDDAKLVFFVCLHDVLILGFYYSNLDTGNRWTRTHIDYHPCITSEPTNQVSVLCPSYIDKAQITDCSYESHISRYFEILNFWSSHKESAYKNLQFIFYSLGP